MEQSNLPDHIKIGQWGEEIACKYLENKGYLVIDRNFRRKWGEIDIICQKRVENIQNGVETKSSTWNRLFGWLKNVLRGTKSDGNEKYVPRGTGTSKLVFVEVKTLKPGHLNPEENVTPAKQKKLIRTCQLYMSYNNLDLDSDWQIDVVAITLNRQWGKAKINHFENAVFY